MKYIIDEKGQCSKYKTPRKKTKKDKIGQWIDGRFILFTEDVKIKKRENLNNG